ncbi:hypothetical protein CLV63_12163 [Murinocardiopsis flavida]|uniref:DUF6879 domain-containing protein n=1 Tax=Murinocardiopsis flavida TaxID=645275 RepID=A0A2P8D145_9ACTN|nr:hypothetical protein CLV63_12163 [Murinocardiopsis flavida]
MELADYLDDFDSRLPHAADEGVWKLERRQSFRQPENASWAAFDRGSWDEALRLLEAASADTANELATLGGMGVQAHRLRIAEEPLSPYLQWEFHALHIRHRHGEDIRVGGADLVVALESAGELPEVVAIGSAVLYRIRYSEEGVLCGATAHDDRGLVVACREEIARLHRVGTPLPGYFDRHVAPLAPPSGS